MLQTSKDLIYNLYYLKLKDFLNKKSFNKSIDNKDIIEQLNKDGIVIIPNYYNEAQCELLVKEVDDLILKYKDTLWEDELGSDKRLWGSEKLSNLFAKFHEDTFLKEIGEAYYESEVYNATTLTNRISYCNNNLGSGGGWHRDNGFHKQFKSIIYLSDVEIDNGPFTYLKGTHKHYNDFKGKLSGSVDKYESRLGEDFINKVVELGYDKQTYTANRGTLILVDTKGIHRGNPLLSGSRYAMFNYFYPKHHVTKSMKGKFTALTPGS